MGISEDFKTFLDNIKIDNAATIALRYGEVTASLNKEFRDTESKTANSLQGELSSFEEIWRALKIKITTTDDLFGRHPYA